MFAERLARKLLFLHVTAFLFDARTGTKLFYYCTAFLSAFNVIRVASDRCFASPAARELVAKHSGCHYNPTNRLLRAFRVEMSPRLMQIRCISDANERIMFAVN